MYIIYYRYSVGVIYVQKKKIEISTLRDIRISRVNTKRINELSLLSSELRVTHQYRSVHNNIMNIYSSILKIISDSIK